MFDTAESAGFWFDVFNGVLLLGAFLVLVGTWGTIRTGAIKEQFSYAETKRAIAESDSAKEGTAKANERIAELSTQAEQLRKDTAEANKIAAEASLALEKFKAPRSLSTEQQQRIADKILQFSGSKFDCAVVEDKEALSFVETIERILISAGWHELPWNSNGGFISRDDKPVIGAGIIEIGISVQSEVAQRDTLDYITRALASALVAEGIEARAEFSNTGMPSQNHTAIHIMVGRKP